jgi:hypothetical protein
MMVTPAGEAFEKILDAIGKAAKLPTHTEQLFSIEVCVVREVAKVELKFLDFEAFVLQAFKDKAFALALFKFFFFLLLVPIDMEKEWVD